MRPLELSVLPESLAISRLEPSAAEPAWARSGPFHSVTRTATELSIVCRADAVPAGVLSRGGWRALGVAGKLDFSLTGILASLATPLAEAGISIFVLSTYDTDFILVQQDALAAAIAALSTAGHRISGTGR